MDTFRIHNDTSKNEQMFICKYCDYITSKQYNYNRHILTPKHIKIQSLSRQTSKNESQITLCNDVINKKTSINNTPDKNKQYKCSCGNIYKYSQGLSKHKKLCNYQKTTIINNDNNGEINIQNTIDKDELILQLLKQNSELLEIMKNGTNTYNNNINSHNKTFNLQVFLNETCKDAMNINDFVDSIKLQLSDFERMGEVGYAQGISDIITSNLQALDITQRPVHCTDKKRETMYVKDQDQWTKEDDNKSKIKKMIKRIENKNIQIIPQFQKKYPNYANPKSHESDKYHKTIIEVMGGPGGSEGKEGKIIRNISKVTTIREKE